jgi:D-alanyl-D-alanine dipeptidase
MMRRWALLGLGLFGCAATVAEARPQEPAFLPLRSVAPSVVVDLRYATAQNFTGKVLYPAQADCYLRAPVAQALAVVATELGKEGLGLKVFDCYRPQRVQYQLWELVHDDRDVANPHKGSRHNRGAAIDLTLVDKDGHELVMPTAFDDFSERAHRSYQALPEEARRNRARLEQAMTRAGFVGLSTEWWHFDAGDWQRYPLSDLPFEALPQLPPKMKP